jgi:RES domain-containing protein
VGNLLNLKKAISSLPITRFDGVVYRVVIERLREKILSTEGNRFYPGRYHVIGETGVLYTSLDEELAVRELSRHADRHALKEKLVAGKIYVRLHNVLDLTQASTLRKLAISKEDLMSSDRLIPQAISIQARKAGLQGLIVPSATGTGQNLIVFENNFGEGCLIEIGTIRIV